MNVREHCQIAGVFARIGGERQREAKRYSTTWAILAQVLAQVLAAPGIVERTVEPFSGSAPDQSRLLSLMRGGRAWLLDCWSDGDTRNHTIMGQRLLLPTCRFQETPTLISPLHRSFRARRPEALAACLLQSSRRADDRDRLTYCGSERSDGDAGHKGQPIHSGRQTAVPRPNRSYDARGARCEPGML